jgi:cell division protein FtsB
MSKINALAALWLGTAVYVALSVSVGRDGFAAQKQLNAQKQRMSLRAEELERTNDELNAEYNALKYDPETIAAYARKLGYVAENEKLLKITGLPARTDTVYDAGAAVMREEIRCLSERTCKISGIAAGCLSYLFLSVRGLSGKRKRRRSATRSYGYSG